MAGLITRADDFGSARAANTAILEAIEKGFIRNVSCMAVGLQIDADAKALEELCRKKKVCIGLHGAVNAEWDYLKFRPMLSEKEIPSVVDEKGMFYMHPMLFKKQMPCVEEVMKEIRAQLDCLTRLGLTISYVDTHMLPDAVIPGLKEAISDFAREKGLISQQWFYTFPRVKQPIPQEWAEPEKIMAAYEGWLDAMEEKEQYISIMHPAKQSMEMLLFQNMALTGDSVAKSRHAEYKILTSGILNKMAEQKGITPIRYTDAVPQGDTLENALMVLS